MLGWEYLSIILAKMRKGIFDKYMALIVRGLTILKQQVEFDTFRKDFVILQLYWWLFSSTKHCSLNMV